jgi:hypothetical protein
VKVAEDEEEGALLEGGFEGDEAGAERGVFVEAEVAELVKPLEEDVAGEAGLDGDVAHAGAEEADGAHAIEAGEGEAAGDLHGEVVFAEGGGGEGHGGGGIDHEPDGEAFGRFEFLDVVFAGAGGDAPVDGFDGVAGLVVAGLDVFEALAEEGGAVGAVGEGVGEAFDREEELAGVEGVGVFELGHGELKG